MADGLALLIALATLAMAFGVFVLPHLGRATRCLLGVGVGVTLILLVAEAPLVAWSALFASVSLYLISCAIGRVSTPTSSGWHNWFVVVVTASTLWLLSIFILWTLEEAVSQPVELTSMGPAVWEVVGLIFDRHLWAMSLLFLLTGAVAWGATGMPGDEK